MTEIRPEVVLHANFITLESALRVTLDFQAQCARAREEQQANEARIRAEIDRMNRDYIFHAALRMSGHAT